MWDLTELPKLVVLMFWRCILLNILIFLVENSRKIECKFCRIDFEFINRHLWAFEDRLLNITNSHVETLPRSPSNVYCPANPLFEAISDHDPIIINLSPLGF